MNHIIKLRSIVILFLFLTACRSQKNIDYLQLYQKAIAKYESKKYYSALQLFQEVMPLLKGKKEIIHAQFCQAYSYFHNKLYRYSAHCFSEFYKTYPRLAQAEEALYMEGYSYYLELPDIRLDQEKTERALKAFELYVLHYKTGAHYDQAIRYRKILYAQLAHKAFKNAKLYYHLNHYRAAVIAFDNFQKTYPDSSYLEKNAYFRIKALYELLIVKDNTPHQNATKSLEFMGAYHQFVDQYATSKYMKEIEDFYILAQKSNPK